MIDPLLRSTYMLHPLHFDGTGGKIILEIEVVKVKGGLTKCITAKPEPERCTVKLP